MPSDPVRVVSGEIDIHDADGAISDSNPLPAVIAPGDNVVNGQNTVAAAGTAEPLGPATALTAGVRVKALHANTGWVYVGDVNVDSTNGYVLDAGEEVFIEIDDLANVYIDVSVGGEGVSFLGS